MKKAFLALLRQPTTIIGIIVALMFQLIFSIVWMTGYNGIAENTKNLTIAIVNEDSGNPIINGLVANLPFKIVNKDELATAQKMLNEREVQMVLHLEQDFTKQLKTPGQTAQIHYYINESNPQQIKSIMQSVANNVTALVNKQAVAAGAQAMLTQVNPNLTAVEAEPMAQGIAERVTSDVQTFNKVDGVHNQMIPMMLVLACFVGSMIKAQNLQISVNAVAQNYGKWNIFGARAILNVLAAAMIGLVSTTMVHLMGGQSAVSFFEMWGFLALALLSFMYFAQIFLILFGNAGMLVNIAMLSTQLVSSGATVPRELLNPFYQHISAYLPATYAVEGNMDLLFGGQSLSGSVWALLGFTVASFVICAVGVAVRNAKQIHVKPGSQPSVS